MTHMLSSLISPKHLLTPVAFVKYRSSDKRFIEFRFGVLYIFGIKVFYITL